MCGAPPQDLDLSGIDLSRQAVVAGIVSRDDAPLAGAYVRLLDSSGEFTAEVVSSPEGVFRFFAAPGSWTLRALSRSGNGELAVDATRGVNEVSISVAAV
jgi:hypothetical protein